MRAFSPQWLFLPVYLLPWRVLASCDELSSLLPGKVFSQGGSVYDASVSSYFFQTQRQSPACFVAPTTAEDVAEIVKAVGPQAPYQVAFRSGGHSPNTGFSNTDHGVTVDLRGLDTIAPRGDTSNAVSVGTGALWVDVYKAVEDLDQTVVGARVASVGAGGFLSGGGLSFFSPQYGFGCDSIQNMQVVLANGSIVDANVSSNPDLFKALKGGQSNFGVVTRFDLTMHPQTMFWGGAIQYPGSADAAQLSAFKAFKEGPYDPFTELEQTFVYFGVQQAFSSTNNMYYMKAVANATTLQPFARIQPQLTNSMRISNASDFAEEVEMLQPTNQFASYSTFSFPISDDVLTSVYSAWKDATVSIAQSQPNITSVLTFQSIPPPPGSNNPPNSMPFPPESTPQSELVLALFSMYWPDATGSDVVEPWLKNLTESVEESVGGAGEYKYLNYAAAWQDPIASYGETNVAELKRTAEMYDPEGFFQNVVSGGFKLPRG